MSSPKLFATDTYTDCTDQFFKDCDELSPGEVKEAPGIQLQNFLSAAQIGIPKIDTGAKYQSFNTELQNFSVGSSDKEISDFLNCLFCEEMAFLDGHSMIQTILSIPVIEKYYHENEPVNTDFKEDDFVGISTLACLESVHLACVYASNGVLFVEEDMHFTQFNFSNFEKVNTQTVIQLVDQAGKIARQRGMPLTSAALERRSSWLTVLRHGIKKTGTAEKLLKLIEPLDKQSKEQYGQFMDSSVQSRLDYNNVVESAFVNTLGQGLQSLTRHLQGILDISIVFKVQRSTDLSGTLLQFCTKKWPALVRAMVNGCMQTTVFNKPAKTWTRMDIAETSPFPLPTKNPQFDEFVENASLCYTDLFKIFLSNRCRVREGLNGLVLSYDSLQVQAAQLDMESTTSTNKMSSNWVLLRKVQAMLWVLLLSFELELVQYNEIAAVYLAAHKICQTMLQHLDQMRTMFEVANKRLEPGHAYLASLVLETEMIQQLCSAEYMLFAALYKQHKPKRPLEKTQYDLRFQGFSTVGIPDMPTFEDYLETMDAFELETALRGAASHSLSVRNLVTELQKMVANNEDLPNLKKSAFGISIAVSQTIKHEGRIESVDVKLDSGHQYFVAPSLKFFDK